MDDNNPLIYTAQVGNISIIPFLIHYIKSNYDEEELSVIINEALIEASFELDKTFVFERSIIEMLIKNYGADPTYESGNSDGFSALEAIIREKKVTINFIFKIIDAIQDKKIKESAVNQAIAEYIEEDLYQMATALVIKYPDHINLGYVECMSDTYINRVLTHDNEPTQESIKFFKKLFENEHKQPEVDTENLKTSIENNQPEYFYEIFKALKIADRSAFDLIEEFSNREQAISWYLQFPNLYSYRDIGSEIIRNNLSRFKKVLDEQEAKKELELVNDNIHVIEEVERAPNNELRVLGVDEEVNN